MAHPFEIWIDVVCRGGGRNDTICTLFARHELPVRPIVGESLSFMQEKGSNLEFNLTTPIGTARSSSVTVAVDEVGHYAVKGKNGVVFNTAVRCGAISVVAEGDARQVCKFMTEQLGFSIDPYALNKLSP